MKIISVRGVRHNLITVSQDFEKTNAKARETIGGNSKEGERPELWDGHAPERIVKLLLE